MTNLPDLIELSKKCRFTKLIVDKGVRRIFGNRKPLTEILNKIKKEKGGLK